MINIQSIILLSPELIVLTTALGMLLFNGIISVRSKMVWVAWVTIGITAAIVACCYTSSLDFNIEKYGFKVSSFTQKIKLILLSVTLVIYYLSYSFLASIKKLLTEFMVLILFSLLGAMTLVSSNDYLMLYLALQLMVLPVYSLIILNFKSMEANEAAFKFFVLGAISSGILLFGLSMIYGATGSIEFGAKAISGDLIFTLGFSFLLLGLLLELGIAPFHFWLPDVYQSAPLSVLLYISTIPKIALSLVVWQLLQVYPLEMSNLYTILVSLSLLSLFVGSILGLNQQSLRKVLAYSTVHHMGFTLLAILCTGATGHNYVLVYIVSYAIASLALLGSILKLESFNIPMKKIDDLVNVKKNQPVIAIVMVVAILSMAGIPPLFGFYAKLLVLKETIFKEQMIISILALSLSTLGVFYYLRLIRWILFAKDSELTAEVKQVSNGEYFLNNKLGELLLPALAMITILCGVYSKIWEFFY